MSQAFESQQPQNSLGMHTESHNQQISEAQIQSARLLETSVSYSKVFRVGLLMILVGIIFYLFYSQFDQFLVIAKRTSKMAQDNDIEEFSGVDEAGYRSFYYYKEMEKMAKENKKNNQTISKEQIEDKFGQIQFDQLFGLFKVLKGVQFAKGYSSTGKEQVDKNMQQNMKLEQIDPQILEKAYNYTDMMQPITNQYSCGSCYSFPITATIQQLYKKIYNIQVKLSQQQLIDCSSENDTINGCSSGNMTKGFEYALKVGLVQQSVYPYRSKGGKSFPCRKEIIQNPNIKKYTISGFHILPKENCKAIQNQLRKGNVVASMISTGQLSTYNPENNPVFRNCPKNPFNHGITIVGQTEKQDWIVRNSWGNFWGIDGYFIIKSGNTCGICTNMIVPYLQEKKDSP